MMSLLKLFKQKFFIGSEETLIISLISITGSLVSWVGSCFLLLTGLTVVGVMPQDSLYSSSTINMMFMVTGFAILKDILFNNSDPKLIVESNRRNKPQASSSLSLITTLFLSVFLLIFHYKGALVQVIQSISSTDYLLTSHIISSTAHSVLDELFSDNLLSPNHTLKFYTSGEGFITNNGNQIILFCGNSRNVWNAPYSHQKHNNLYIKYENEKLSIYEGILPIRKLGFPFKYLYYLFTLLFQEQEPILVSGKLVWSQSIKSSISSDSDLNYRFESNILSFHKKKNEKLIPWKKIYMNELSDILDGCTLNRSKIKNNKTSF